MAQGMSQLRRLCLGDLPTPAFVINRHAFAKNCDKVLQMVQARNLKLRPHVKTHKTVEGTLLQVHGLLGKQQLPNPSITGFVASTIPEVSMLVDLVLKETSLPPDILYGVPICQARIPVLLELRRKLLEGYHNNEAHIHVLMDHVEQVTMVEETLQDGGHPVSVFCKLDTGYHRAGVPCDERSVELIESIVNSPHLKLKGLYSHCGHAYDVNDSETMQTIVNNDLSQIQHVIELLESSNPKKYSRERFQEWSMSVGSTPSLFYHQPKNTTTTLTNNLEIHPGNYTLYDRQQLYTGACSSEDDIAGRVMARVIGTYDDRIMLDAGATALTKEMTPQGGMAAIIGGRHSTSDGCEVYKMSQEVSLVRQQQSCNNVLQTMFPLGSMVNLLPNHSCLAAACFDKYYIIDDPSNSFAPDEPIVDEWIPVKGFTIPFMEQSLLS